MEYTMFFQGAEIGHVEIEAEGLYYRLSASAAAPGHGIWRLWGCFGADSRCLGVLSPETGGLKLVRRVSRHSWPVLPEAFVLGREAEGFRPWRGVLEGQELPDAMVRTEGSGNITLAIFAPPEGPLPFAERTDQMREGELGGRSCLLLDWPPEELKVEN